MLKIPRFFLSPAEFVPIFSTRFAGGRLSVCLVLAAINFAVIVTCAPCLFQISAHHPVWLTGVVALFTSLLGSLLRVWFLLIFRVRLR